MLFRSLDDLLSEITHNKHAWEIKRALSKNQDTLIYHLIMCGRITNSIIGKAISNNISHIVTVSRFRSKEQQFIVDDFFELLYKNDIFVISLGDDWLFRTALGKKMVTIILNNTNSSLWNTNIGVENIFIGLKTNLEVAGLFSRLRNCVYYFPAKLEKTKTSISTILVIKASFDTLTLKEFPDLILTMELTPSLITFCYHMKIILVFVHSDVFYFEIARDLSYLLVSSLNVPTTLGTSVEYKIAIK